MTATAARRPRLAAEERRRQLVDATLAVLAEHGAQGASLRLVCRRAEVAPSLVAHFFSGWSDLLGHAYQALTDRFTAQLVAALSIDAAPRERLAAAIEVFFSEEWLAPAAGDAYVALWALSRTEVDLRTRMTAHYDDLRRLLARALAAHAGTRAGAKHDADALLIHLNGLWMEMVLNPGHLTARQAVRMAWYWIDRLATPAAER